MKFTNAGGQINISAKKDDEFATITIADNGIGIQPENLIKLFENKHQNTVKGTSGELGVGLGLMLCKQFIEKHKGHIWVESEYGKGTRFSFTLPAAK